MRSLSLVVLVSAILTGCASTPPSADGTWINQTAIDAAAASGNLREALLAYGPNLEWQVSTAQQHATLSNGFEQAEGDLHVQPDGRLRVDFYGDYAEWLSLDGNELLQAQSPTAPEQRFSHVEGPDLALGTRFEHALYSAYLGGKWTIEAGEGQGGLVLFNPYGSVQGLPGAQQYALCLAGDCAAMSGENDSIWLQLGEQGQTWLFEHNGDQLRIFQAVNRAAIDEMPDYSKGPQRWLLRRH
ncbi:hypothetical protein [Pseudomonas sp. 5P_3.1_Bac2]|uniref:hypothetical protein n=1 Tax=Pseudomonas sp. 5P_3.1_Bac2 TaxID=2971617 RepID=UPI0021C8CCF2|nr:hypothetical protein [Pseudomonas sp. 5P_3.1_Bac2]MCU1718920.1 hypothetical protein [Pseudomonas sp. 5P_3.1_Bac2]